MITCINFFENFTGQYIQGLFQCFEVLTLKTFESSLFWGYFRLFLKMKVPLICKKTYSKICLSAVEKFHSFKERNFPRNSFSGKNFGLSTHLGHSEIALTQKPQGFS